MHCNMITYPIIAGYDPSGLQSSMVPSIGKSMSLSSIRLVPDIPESRLETKAQLSKPDFSGSFSFTIKCLHFNFAFLGRDCS